MDLDLADRIEKAIALADGVRRPASVPASSLARARKGTAMIATAELGIPSARAAEFAAEVEAALCEFADALVAAAEVARKIIALNEKYHEERTRNVQAG